MKNHTDIKEYAEAAGKTVESINYCGSEPQVAIYFTDGTCLVLQAEAGEWDEGPGIHQVGIKKVSDWDRVRHGMLTEAEAQERGEQRRAEHLKQEQENRWRQYRILRNEFKDVPDPVPPPCNCGICQSHGQGTCRGLGPVLEAQRDASVPR